MVEIIRSDRAAETAWFGRSGSARACCRMALEGDVGAWVLECIRVTHNGAPLAAWTPEGKWVRYTLPEEEQGPTPLQQIEAEAVVLWAPSKLRRYCHAIPKMLLLAFSNEQLTDLLPLLPRDKGPYTLEDLERVSADGLTAEVGGGLEAWTRLLGWAQSSLYPEYTRRMGKAHGSEVYAEWLAWAPEVQAALAARFTD